MNDNNNNNSSNDEDGSSVMAGNDNSNSSVIPSTPESQRHGPTNDNDNDMSSSIPGTPLTPLSDMDHDDNDNDNRTDAAYNYNERSLAIVQDDDDDDDEEEENDNIQDTTNTTTTNTNTTNNNPTTRSQGPETLIRGTDVHVPTAATTFQTFLREFQSLQHSQKVQAEKAKQQKKQQQDKDDNNDHDDSSSSDSDDDDDHSLDSNAPPFYLSKLQNLITHGSLHIGGNGTNGHDNDSDDDDEDDDEDQDDSSPTSSSTASRNSLDIDTMHLYYHNASTQKFYHQLIAYPMEMVPLMDLIVQQELELLLEQEQQTPQNSIQIPPIQVRPFNLRSISNLRQLDPINLDTLLCIRGMVVRTSTIIPDLKVAHFSCTICGNEERSTIDRGTIQEPTLCSSCKCRHSFTLVHNRCVYADKQMCRLQETPDEVPSGQTPASLVGFAFDDLVDTIQPGDRIEMTGVLRAQPRRVHPKITKLKTVYKTYVDVIHFKKIYSGGDSRTSVGMSGKTKFTKSQIDEFHRLSKLPNIYDQLTQSFAPSIWELDNTKKGILCMLFGGNSKRIAPKKNKKKNKRDGYDSDNDSDMEEDDNNNNSTTTPPSTSTTKHALQKRGDINILLCGDPGTSKSQLLSYVHKLSSRGVYTSGKGSSAVGLTASVVRDPETRDLVLESGALVLSDLGICCIDEFDKMSDATRSVLHEAMEQQTVSIAKAGIIATLRARTSVLASANPQESRYNPSKSVVDNIQLPPTLLSRFDLIYLILDSPNIDFDRRLAQHLVGLYYETPNVIEPPLSQDLLRNYIEYAKQTCTPLLGDDATKELIQAYVEMRGSSSSASNNSGKRTISATPRQLESLIRLSEGLAKMKLSNIVTPQDVQEATRLMKVATQAAATDPKTGKIDMDMITTGKTSGDRQHQEELHATLKEILLEGSRSSSKMMVRDITRQMTEITNVVQQSSQVVETLRQMEADGFVQFNERAQTVHVRRQTARQ